MKIEFLMTDRDVISFTDFLYASGLIVFKNKFIEGKECLIPMSKDDATAALCVDLLTISRLYAIGKCDRASVLNLWSCNSLSHPRFTTQMGRDTGYISCETQDDPLLFASIKKYFRTHYKSQKYGRTRFRCYFGPDYLKLDSSYLNAPEPTYICNGFIQMVCPREYTAHVHNVLLNVLQKHPELSSTGAVYSREGVNSSSVEQITGILLDRSQYGMDHIIQIAQELACQNHRLRAVREKRYEEVFSTPKETLSTGPQWHIRVSVKQEWKGFGNFEPSGTWLVKT